MMGTASPTIASATRIGIRCRQGLGREFPSGNATLMMFGTATFSHSRPFLDPDRRAHALLLQQVFEIGDCAHQAFPCAARVASIPASGALSRYPVGAGADRRPAAAGSAAPRGAHRQNKGWMSLSRGSEISRKPKGATTRIISSSGAIRRRGRCVPRRNRRPAPAGGRNGHRHWCAHRSGG
jgi:hypothetical protein